MEVTKEIFIEGDLIEKSKVKICYKGKFTREFSNEVYVVFGYGSEWKDIKEEKMTWIGDGFYADIELISCGTLNFCFKNDFGSWDNNFGNDYSIEIKPEEIIDVIEITKEAEKIIIPPAFQETISEVKIEEDKEEFQETISEVKTEEDKEELQEDILEGKTEEDKEDLQEDILEVKIEENEEEPQEEFSKNNKKDKKKNRRKVKKILNIFFLSLLIITIIYVVINFIRAKGVEKENTSLWDSVTEKVKEKFEVNERIEKVKKLKADYPDLKAWLEIPNTSISYPVMQGVDNDYYVKHDYKGEGSKWGALFVDKAYDWEKPSSNILIYGHNFSDSIMFSDLIKYKNKEFYDEHKTIKLTTIDEDAEYEIIAVFNSRVYYTHEENVFRYYFFVDAKNEAEYNEYVKNAKKVSLYDIDATAEYGEQLLTLSTCDYIQEDGRFVVVARKIENKENN